jgi:hypothetical protein
LVLRAPWFLLGHVAYDAIFHPTKREKWTTMEAAYDGLNRRIVKDIDTKNDGTMDATRHFYYSSQWAGWWLNGAVDVKVHGDSNVCKVDGKYLVKNLNAKWQWHDRIDGNSFATLIENGETIPVIGIEGSWDLIQDKLRGVDFEIIVNFDDSIHKNTFPPGPSR